MPASKKQQDPTDFSALESRVAALEKDLHHVMERLRMKSVVEHPDPNWARFLRILRETERISGDPLPPHDPVYGYKSPAVKEYLDAHADSVAIAKENIDKEV